MALGIANVYAALQEEDETIAWLENAYRNREDGLILLNSYPHYGQIRSDPRFLELARKIGVPE